MLHNRLRDIYIVIHRSDSKVGEHQNGCTDSNCEVAHLSKYRSRGPTGLCLHSQSSYFGKREGFTCVAVVVVLVLAFAAVARFPNRAPPPGKMAPPSRGRSGRSPIGSSGGGGGKSPICRFANPAPSGKTSSSKGTPAWPAIGSSGETLSFRFTIAGTPGN